MVAIHIADLEISSIVEIPTDEISSIRGGTRLKIDPEYFLAVEDLQAIKLLLVDGEQDPFEDISVLSLRNIRKIFEFTVVLP